MKMSIIVIVYNEVKTIKQAIDDVRSFEIDKEIIVIDNCSTDGTVEVLKRLNYEDINIIYQSKNYGVGKSYETGFNIAKGNYIFVQHADLEYDHTICLEMLNLAERDKLDAIFGSRLKNYLKKGSRWELLKSRPAYLASYISTYLINKWYGYNFTDVIGAEFYKTSVIKSIPIHSYHTGFKFEHVSRMCKKGLKIGEINVGYSPRENPREKKIKAHNIFNALWSIIKVRFLS